MCGIFGWYRWRPTTTIDYAALATGLFSANLERGHDAAGIGYLDQGTIRVVKRPGPADKFVKAHGPDFWQAVATSPVVIGHTRAQTKGSPNNNENNHPVVLNPWAVVHNGSVHNDDDLFEHFHAERFAEVDTAAIPLVLRQAEVPETLTNLGLLGGSVTAAMWSSRDPSQLFLARLGMNDVYLFLLEQGRCLVFSSTPHIMNVIPSIPVASLRFVSATALADNRVLCLRPAGAEMLEITRAPIRNGAGFATWRRKWDKHGTTDNDHVLPSPLTPAVDRPKKPTSDSGFRWLNPEVNRVYLSHSKPAPLFGPCLPLSYTSFDIDLVTDYLLEHEDKPFLLETPYGRWTTAPGDLELKFKPHKSVRKFVAKAGLPEWWQDDCQDLPNGLMTWESIELIEHHEVASTVISPGYMCAWCGCLMPRYKCYAAKWTCPWCLIHSKEA